METTASTSITASARLHAAFAAVRGLDLPDTAEGPLRAGLDVAEIVRTLDADDDVVIAAMLHPLLDAHLDHLEAHGQFGAGGGALARAAGVPPLLRGKLMDGAEAERLNDGAACTGSALSPVSSFGLPGLGAPELAT